MIRTGNTSDFNEPFISLDLSDKKHKKRVIDFFESKNPISGEMDYSIRALWTDSKFHPTMRMDADEFIEFVEALNVWVARIKRDAA